MIFVAYNSKSGPILFIVATQIDKVKVEATMFTFPKVSE